MLSIDSYNNLFPVMTEWLEIKVLDDSELNQIEVIS